MSVAQVELTLGAKPPTLNRVIVDGVDLAKVVRTVDVHADAQAIPTVTLELSGPQLIKADARVRLLVGRFGMRNLLTAYRAQHTEACNRQAPAQCTCGLTDLLNSESVEIPASQTAQGDPSAVVKARV